MQTVNVPVVDTRAMEHQTITINVVPAAVKGILTTLGAKPREVDTLAPAEQFIISANLVLQLRRVLMVLQLRIILLLVVLLDIQQHGLQVVVQVEDINGMDTITFYVLFADV